MWDKQWLCFDKIKAVLAHKMARKLVFGSSFFGFSNFYTSMFSSLDSQLPFCSVCAGPSLILLLAAPLPSISACSEIPAILFGPDRASWYGERGGASDSFCLAATYNIL